MRLLLTLLAAALLSAATTSCGGASKHAGAAPQPASSTSTLVTTPTTASSAPSTVSTTATTHATGRPKDFSDGDDDSNIADDNVVLEYGHLARPADKQAVTTVATRYYQAAAADNGAEGCALMHAVIVESIPETYDKPGSPARGTTCPAVMSKLFAQRHKQLIADLAGLEVTGVRVEGENALALLRLRTTPEPRKIELHREGGAWKIWALFDSGLP